MNKLEFLKNELRHLRDNYDMDDYSYNKIDLALDELNEVTVADNNNHNYYIGYILDEIHDAMDRGDLPSDLSEKSINKIVNLITNDDSVWNNFYSQLGEMFYMIKNGTIDVRDTKYEDMTVVKPIYFQNR